MRCSSDEDLQVGVVSRSGERRRNSDNILPVTVCCWAMDRNIGEMLQNCEILATHERIRLEPDIFTAALALLSGFIERFKSFKNTETCVKIWSFMFSRQQSADWAGVYVWSVGVLLLFYNKIHLILAPLSRLRLGQSWPHFHIPLHQHLIGTTHKKDCI